MIKVFTTEKQLRAVVQEWMDNCTSPEEFEQLLVNETTVNEYRVRDVEESYTATDLSLLI